MPKLFTRRPSFPCPVPIVSENGNRYADYSLTNQERMNTLINRHINKAMEKEDAGKPKRTYLGASYIGEPCERQVYYKFKHPLNMPAKSLRRFELGHIQEDRTIAWLRAAGFVVLCLNEQGEQYGFKSGNYAGHVDGVILAGPVNLPYPLLFEHKIMKNSKFNEFTNHGIQAKFPTYWAQVQEYMGYSPQFMPNGEQLNGCLFTAYNTDTSDLAFEFVQLSVKEAQKYSDRAVRIQQAKSAEDLPRIATIKSAFACKFCDYKEQCWKDEEDE